MKRSAIAALALAACTTTKGAEIPPVDTEPLPEGREALLAESDRKAAFGPGGPDLARSLRAAEAALTSEPQDGEAAWRAARAIYFQTLTAGEDETEAITGRCMKHGELAVKTSSAAEAPFFHALCMGARAKVKGLEALGLLKKMVAAAEEALARDPAVMHAGPNRMLGGLYLRAPAWPTSVGDPDEALSQLEKAVALAPDWPENHLFLAEAYLEHKRPDEARRHLDLAESLLAAPTVDGWRPLFRDHLEKLRRKLPPPPAAS